ncbi:hypothetical protein PP747_gp099 [Rhizobium phage RHph_Y38]|uniref:Uncharacterized protein n=1 Tax=Rhizobium phage RHph_Y38 TaxID=2509781 RepID=A0A7S5R933_9CAUD|nr:hypothetical protein PP747_gp099 [Rhizobium phage RHph_Y38]QIG67799.1 hypothetical protein EVB52_100 [Rhizobium phage RHph_Y38]
MTPENIEKIRIYHASIRAKIAKHRKWGESFASIEIDILTFIMNELEKEQTINEQLARQSIHYYTA